MSLILTPTFRVSCFPAPLVQLEIIRSGTARRAHLQRWAVEDESEEGPEKRRMRKELGTKQEHINED